MSKNKIYDIIVADDHRIFLDGLKMIFESESNYRIVAEATNGKDVLAYFKSHSPDFAIIDINMPKPNGFEICTAIHATHPQCKIIVLSMYNDPQFVKVFNKSGASAYVLKNAGKSELLKALETALNGDFYISKELQDLETIEADGFVKSQKLTKRELEIIQLLSKGESSTSIAKQLFLSIYTVNTHRKNILHKLGLKNVAELIGFASENQLL
jgi:two-component system nitrate/nitrite response regulator NarL